MAKKLKIEGVEKAFEPKELCAIGAYLDDPFNNDRPACLEGITIPGEKFIDELPDWVTLENVRTAYRGRKEGCRCGCNGKYYVPKGKAVHDYDKESDRAVNGIINSIADGDWNIEFMHCHGSEWFFNITNEDNGRVASLYVDKPAEQEA